jgi:hypothetical protein
VIGLGVAATAIAGYLAFRGVGAAPVDTGPGAVAWLVGIGGLLVALWLLYAHTRSPSETDPVPWSDAGPIVHDTPEAAPQRHPMSGSTLTRSLRDAAVGARENRDPEAGLSVVRPLLRETYREAAVVGGQDREAVEAALDEGSWTADGVAAAACSETVDLPTRSLKQRVLDWLYPGRAAIRMTVRAVGAVDDAASEALPPVIGSDAPRQVPAYEASLAPRTLGADGRLDQDPPFLDEAESDESDHATGTTTPEETEPATGEVGDA